MNGLKLNLMKIIINNNRKKRKMFNNTITLSNEVVVPQLALGTWILPCVWRKDVRRLKQNEEKAIGRYSRLAGC